MRGRRAIARNVLAALVAFALAFVLFRWSDFTLPSVGGAKYQAVFLANGQTYFGRYLDRLGAYVKVENAYYIQQTRTEDESAPPESKLIRRGSELHKPYPFVLIQPADGLHIRRDKVLAVERVDLASSVAQAIAAQRALERSAAAR